MASQQYHCLRDLRPGTYNWNIKVRIIRLWRGVSAKGDEFKGLNMLLLDDKKCRMHAFVPGMFIEKHEQKLLLGNICTFSNFTVKDYRSDEKFRCIQSERQIILTNYTKVENLTEDDSLIPNNMFNFYDLTDLDKIANENIYLTDIIGVIEKDMPLTQVVNRFGQQQVHFKFTIVDGSGSANITFWDSLAEELQLALQEVSEHPPIIIIASAKINSWQRTPEAPPLLDISNAAATKFYINYDHPIVSQIRKMLGSPLFAKYDFSSQIPQKIEVFSVHDIQNLDNIYIEKEVICHVKVTLLCEELGWFYYVCTSCYEEIDEKVDGLWKCFRCNQTVPYPDKKIRFCVEAEDSTGSIDIMIDDQEARTIVFKTAYEVEDEDENNTTFPKLLKTILNKFYTVKLQLTQPNIEKVSSIYTATGIYETSEEHIPKNEIRNKQTQMQQSMSQGTTSTYHLDDFAELNFKTPEIKHKKKKKVFKMKKK